MPSPTPPRFIDIKSLNVSSPLLTADSLIVLLGCPTLNREGRPNFYFEARVTAGAFAYHAVRGRPEGRATPRLLCSGLDEAGEVAAFREGLVRAGVPAEAIELDGASARTIDSIDFVANHLAALEEDVAPRNIAFVSQRFHLPRVLYLARSRELDALGLVAEGRLTKKQGRLREVAARARAVVDVHLLRRNPQR